VISTTGTATNYEVLASYTLTVTVSDGTATVTATDIAITITDVNEASPVFGDGDTATANVAEVTTVGTYSATDADGTASLAYSIVASGTNAASVDHDLFAINSATGALTFAAAPNYEAPGCGAGNNANVCVVVLSVSDGTNADTITVTATVTDLNEASPVFSDGDSASANVAELTTAVGTYTATDADGTATQTYSILAVGANAASVDHDLFAINSASGVLTFASAPDFETPGCGANNNANVCVVVLSVTDGANTDTITVTATVTDVAPIITASQTANLAESASANDDVMTVATTGDAATAFVISAGNSQGVFKISSAGLIEVASTTNLDFESTTSYTLTILAADATGTADIETVAITITDVNEAAPVFDDGATNAVNVAEGTTTVATYSATDADTANTLTYSIVASGTNAASVDHDLFAINSATGALTFAAAPNFEALGCGAGNNANGCVVVLSVTDSTAGSADDTITVTVTITNVAIAITAGQSANLAENTGTGNAVMTVATTGDTDSDSFAITAGNTATVFSINAATGVISTTGTATNYEVLASYTLTVTVSDGTATVTATDIAIAITDVNEASPVFGDGDTDAVNVAEGTTTVATYSATDADGTASLAYSIVASGTNAASVDHDLFAINSATGALTFAAAPNFEALGCGAGNNANGCVVVLSVTDGANTDTITVTATITDVNEAAPVFDDGDTATANVAEGTTTVATYGATDADTANTLTYSIVAAGTNAASVDHDLFSIVSGTGALTFAAAPNFEALGCGANNNANGCVVVLSVTDSTAGSADDTITVTVTITDVNEASPVFGDGDTDAVNVAEGTTTVATYSATDADGTASLAYSIVASGTNAASVDHDLFAINSATGALTFAAAPNFEALGCGAGNNANGCVVVLSVTDGANTDTITVTATITDVNEAAPVFDDGDTATANVAEGTTTVATYGATDADTANTLTYSIVAAGTNAASVDHDLFSIVSGTGALTFAAAPNFEALGCGANNNANGCVVVLSVTDSTAGSADDTITVTVTITDVNEAAPVFDDGATNAVNVAEGTTTVATYSATDADTANTLTYSIVASGTNAASVDHDLFAINSATGALTFAAAPNFEALGCGAGNNANGCVVVLSVTDSTAGSADDTITVTVTITNVNEAPVFGDGDSATANVAEGTTTVGTYSATDVDASATQTYSIVAASTNAASVDHDLFAINSATGALTFAAAPNFEALGCGAGNNANGCVVVLSVTDGALTDTITVTATITDVNEASPVFGDGDTATANVAEGTTTVATYSATDADTANTLTYSIVAASTNAASVDHDLFAINSATGALTFAAAPNFEALGCGAGNNANGCVVVLSVSDGTNTDTITVTATITDVNEAAPVFDDGDTATANVAEGTTTVATYGATDADTANTLTYSIVAASTNAASVDHDLFSIVSGTGALTFAAAPNFEALGCGAGNNANGCVVVLSVTDSTAGSADDTITVTVTITDVNEAAPVFGDGDTATANVAEGTTTVATYSATDADTANTLTYSIVAASTNAASVDHDLFSIVSGTGALTFAAAPNFEALGCGANNNANGCVVVLSVRLTLAQQMTQLL
jgi:hypothetical protein